MTNQLWNTVMQTIELEYLISTHLNAPGSIKMPVQTEIIGTALTPNDATNTKQYKRSKTTSNEKMRHDFNGGEFSYQRVCVFSLHERQDHPGIDISWYN